MIQRPPGVGVFQFVVLSKLRAAQLMRGCRPRVDGAHKAVVTAQMEVAEGKVTQMFDAPVAVGVPTRSNAVPVPVEDLPVLV